MQKIINIFKTLENVMFWPWIQDDPSEPLISVPRWDNPSLY